MRLGLKTLWRKATRLLRKEHSEEHHEKRQRREEGPVELTTSRPPALLTSLTPWYKVAEIVSLVAEQVGIDAQWPAPAHCGSQGHLRAFSHFEEAIDVSTSQQAQTIQAARASKSALLAMALVCRGWTRPASELLLQRKYLRRVDLRTKGLLPAVCSRVTGLTINFFVCYEHLSPGIDRAPEIIESCVGLRSLVLDHFRVSSEDAMRLLRAIATLPFLESLTLADNGLFFYDGIRRDYDEAVYDHIWTVLAGCRALRTLACSMLHLYSRNPPPQPRVYPRNLERLTMDHVDIRRIDFWRLLKASAASLTCLDLQMVNTIDWVESEREDWLEHCVLPHLLHLQCERSKRYQGVDPTPLVVGSARLVYLRYLCSGSLDEQDMRTICACSALDVFLDRDFDFDDERPLAERMVPFIRSVLRFVRMWNEKAVRQRTLQLPATVGAVCPPADLLREELRETCIASFIDLIIE